MIISATATTAATQTATSTSLPTSGPQSLPSRLFLPVVAGGKSHSPSGPSGYSWTDGFDKDLDGWSILSGQWAWQVSYSDPYYGLPFNVYGVLHASLPIWDDSGFRCISKDFVFSSGHYQITGLLYEKTDISNWAGIAQIRLDGTLLNQWQPGWFPPQLYTRVTDPFTPTAGTHTVQVCMGAWNTYQITLIDQVTITGDAPVAPWAPDCNCSQSKNGPGDPREPKLATHADTQGAAGDPINTRTGGLYYAWDDLSISTLAGPMVFQRTYASAMTNTYTTTLGYGWTDNLDTRLILNPDTIWLKGHSTNQYRFDVVSVGGVYNAYVPFPGVLAALTSSTVPTTTYMVTVSDQSVYSFNFAGQLTSWLDPQGHAISYTYGVTTSLLSQVLDPVTGHSLNFDYDPTITNRLVDVRDDAGRQVSFGYNGSGDLTSVTDVMGQDWTYAYSGTTHLLTNASDPRGTTIVQTAYDEFGRATDQYDGLDNHIAQVDYHLAGTAVITDARGISQTHTYDARQTLTSAVGALGSSTSKAYNSNFRPSSILDALGQPVTLTWSEDGANLSQVTNALSQSIGLNYDALNNLTQESDARGYSSQLLYSGKLLTATTDALSQTTRYTYTTAADAPLPVGLLKANSDPLGRTTLYQYDNLGQLKRMTDTAGIGTSYGYDDLGRVLTTTTHVGTALEQITIQTYDAASRMTQITRNYTSTNGAQNYTAGDSIYNQITSYGYDQVGNQTLVTDTLGHVTKTDFDALNRPLTVTVNYAASASGPDVNVQTVAQYDANGNVISVTQFAGTAGARTTVSLYDALNRPISTTANFTGSGAFSAAFPDQNVTTLTAYDAAGNVISTTQYYGSTQARTTTTSYDVLNRPVSMMLNSSGGSGADQNIQSLAGYDENGNVISTTQYANLPSLARTRLTAYDPLNRPVTVTTNATGGSGTDQNLQTLTVYNSAGQVISITQAFGTSQARTTYTQYDSAGRPVTVTTNYDGSGVAGVARNLMQVTVYGPAGERAAAAERRVYPDGSTTWITTTLAYNNQGQLLQTTYPLTTGVVASTAQAYDPLGRSHYDHGRSEPKDIHSI